MLKKLAFLYVYLAGLAIFSFLVKLLDCRGHVERNNLLHNGNDAKDPSTITCYAIKLTCYTVLHT